MKIFMFMLLIVGILSLVGCFDDISEEDKTKIRDANANIYVLAQEIIVLKRQLTDGEITPEDASAVRAMITELTSEIAEQKQVISEVSGSGASGWSIAGFWLVSLVADMTVRGRPSKGILGKVLSALGMGPPRQE